VSSALSSTAIDPAKAAADDGQHLVSVVVPTRDSIRTIERCLRSIREQTWPEVELVVVDNYSTDGTWEVAQEFAHRAIKGGPERSTRRNLGLDSSNGEWVLWIDSDMELPVTLIERAMEAARRASADAVFIPEATAGDGYWTRCRSLERSCCSEASLVQSPRLVKRQYLMDSGGFLPSLTGTKHAELRTRILRDGLSMTRIHGLIIHDEGRLKLTGILRKRYYNGKGLGWHGRSHSSARGAQLKAALGTDSRNWRRFTAEPGVAVGVLAMRAFEYAAYGLGAIVGWRTRAGG
jgi:glycosyltransferase involved in cell wall biosynthesis